MTDSSDIRDSKKSIGTRRRGKGAKAARGILIGLAAFVVIVLTYALFFSAPMILHYGFPAGNEALAESGFELKADWIAGRPIKGLTFGNFAITHKDSAGEVQRVFSADTMTVKYDIAKLLRKQWRIESVYFVNPEILLIKPPAGGVLLPGLKGDPDRELRDPEKPPGGPTVEIASIELNGATLRISTRTGEERFEDMDIACSFVRKPSGMTIGLGRASFRMPGRSMNISSTSADLFYTAGSLTISDGVAHFLSSVIDFSGRMTFRGLTRFDMVSEGRPYDVPELAAIFGAEWPEGRLEGRASVTGPTDSLAIDAIVSGYVERYALEDMKVLALRTSSYFSFSKAEGLVNGAEIDASGRLRGGSQTFDVDFRGLNASSGFFPDVSFPDTDLSGRADVRHPAPGAPWEIQADMGRGHVADFHFDSLFYDGRVTSDAVAVDSVDMKRPGMAATAGGTIGIGAGGEMDLSFTADVDSAAYPAAWLGAVGLEGSLNAAGTLRGASSNPILESRGPLRVMERGPFKLEGGSFEVRVDGLGGGGAIDFGVSEGDLTVASERLGVLALDGEYGDGVLRVPSFGLAKGDSSANGSFTLETEDGELRVDAAELELLLDDVSWRAADQFTFSYSSGAYSLQGLRLVSDGGVLAVSGRLDRPGERIELNVAATGLDMSSIKLMNRDFGGGVASGQLTLRGPLKNPPGTARLDWKGVNVLGQEAREVVVRCELKDDGLAVERLSIDSPAGLVLVTGRVDMGLDLSEIFSGRGVEFLRRMGSVPLDLSTSVRDLDLSWLDEAAGLDRDLAGTLSFSGEVGGTPREPVLRLDVVASSLKVAGVSVDECSGSFEYEDGRLGILEAKAARGDVSAGIQGYLPLALGVEGGARLPSDEPMALEVKVAPGDFAVVADVWDGLAYSSGTFDLDATITGTLSTPALSGSGWFRDCTFRLAGMEEEYRGVGGRFSLKGDRIEIAEISGRDGGNGRFSGSGSITLGWPGLVDYGFDFRLSQFSVLTPLDVDAVLSGELEVAAYSLEDGSLIPKITGAVTVDEAVYTGRVGAAADLTEGAAGGGTVTPSWLADVEIDVPGNAWVNTADAELELAGDILFIKDFDGLKPRGALEVTRGKYFLVNTEFEVTSGTVTFGEAVGVDPDLDISAETVIGLGETGDEETVYVHLTGTASDPRIRVSSTSGYSETDIYEMLLAGVLWGQGPSEPGDPDISVLATNTLFNAIDSRLRDIFGSRPPVQIGLTREEADESYAGSQETRISVGRNLSRSLFLRYEQGFSAITRREVNLDYRVSRHLLLRSQIINNPERGVREEAGSEINFDLRLRYEF